MEAKKSIKRERNRRRRADLIATGEGFIRQAGPSERHQTLLSLPPLYLFFPVFSLDLIFLQESEEGGDQKRDRGRVAKDVRKIKGEERIEKRER